MAGSSHSPFRFTAVGLALAGAALVACDAGPKARVESEDPDAARPDAAAAGGAEADAAATGGTVTPADASPLPGGDALPAPDMGVSADAAPPADAALLPPDANTNPPEVCNGEDDDLDGEVDEDVANLCGGCGGIPEAGCQAWRVDLTQTAEDAQTLNPNRIVGLQGSVTSLSERDIDGAHCVFQRALAPGPDAHLGIVTITSPLVTLTQVPTFDAIAQTIRYDNSPALGPTQVFSAGQVVRVQAGGGQLVPAFDAELIGPMRVEGTAADELQGAIDVIRGARAEPATLHWLPGAGEADGTLRLFAGGSRSQFNRGGYRGIFHYQLDVRLADDGEFTVGPALSRLGLSDSSIWVYLRRENYRRVVIGPHAVELAAASRAELRASGNLDAQDPPAFQITSPSPDAPRIEPGLPVTIRWTPPPADGPLTISLIYGDAEGLESRYVGCEVAHPETGELVLPAEATLGWPVEPDATRILTVRQDLATVAVPPGTSDRGQITYAYSLLLPLAP